MKKPSALRIARVCAGLSQDELGELAGLHRASIAMVETGARNAGPRFRRDVAAVLGMSEERLFPEVLAGKAPAAETAE
jgi:transcriptional regulator with XRE-family HTH domain